MTTINVGDEKLSAGVLERFKPLLVREGGLSLEEYHHYGDVLQRALEYEAEHLIPERGQPRIALADIYKIPRARLSQQIVQLRWLMAYARDPSIGQSIGKTNPYTYLVGMVKDLPFPPEGPTYDELLRENEDLKKEIKKWESFYNGVKSLVELQDS